MNNKVKFLSLCLLFLVATASCVKDDGPAKNNPKIRLAVAASRTRSAVKTTEGLETEGQFVLDAICDNEWKEYDADGKVIPDGKSGAAGPYIVSGGNYNVNYSSAQIEDTDRDGEHTDFWYINDASGVETYNWLTNDLIRFWCHWPAASACNGTLVLPTYDASYAGKSEMTFSYALPTHVDGKDADNQQDILFAYADRKYAKDEDDEIDIIFNHPLSEIRFCVSPDDGTFDVSLSIKKIEISNVPTGGTCAFDGKGLIQPTSENPDAMFTWTPSGNANYSQDVDDVMFDSKPADWNNSSYTNASSETKHLYVSTNNFLLIPHTLAWTAAKASTNTQLSVTFGNTGTGEDITKTVDLVVPSSDQSKIWKPGHYYTYKIEATMIGRDIHVYVILADWSDRESKIIIS